MTFTQIQLNRDLLGEDIQWKLHEYLHPESLQSIQSHYSDVAVRQWLHILCEVVI